MDPHLYGYMFYRNHIADNEPLLSSIFVYLYCGNDKKCR